MWPFQKYGGLIAGHKLGRWWQSLKEEDRRMARELTSRSLCSFHPLDSGPPHSMHGTKADLVSLAEWFKRDEHRELGRKIMAHAAALPHDAKDALEMHFMLHGMVQFYYRCRNDCPDFLPKCEHACREMISMAPQAAAALQKKFPKSALPAHSGYGRLCWLLDKRGDAEGARLRLQAERAGWIVSI